MKAFTVTDVGKVRRENQDSVRYYKHASPSFSILALCDGMGGAKAGQLASEIALDAFMSESIALLSDRKNKEQLCHYVAAAATHANDSVFERARADARCEGMGTTLVAVIVKGRSCCIVNVGDSRAYLISGGAIVQLTRDHSLVEEMIDRGSITREQAKNHPRKNVITRALGADELVEVDIFTPELKKNDLLLLCSDGLSNTLTDAEILEIISNQKNLPKMGQDLLDAALFRGAPDNVTVGLLRK